MSSTEITREYAARVLPETYINYHEASKLRDIVEEEINALSEIKPNNIVRKLTLAHKLSKLKEEQKTLSSRATELSNLLYKLGKQYPGKHIITRLRVFPTYPVPWGEILEPRDGYFVYDVGYSIDMNIEGYPKYLSMLHSFPSMSYQTVEHPGRQFIIPEEDGNLPIIPIKEGIGLRLLIPFTGCYFFLNPKFAEKPQKINPREFQVVNDGKKGYSISI